MNFKKDVSLADYISFKLGGKAKYFLVAKKKQDIIEAVKTAKENGRPVEEFAAEKSAMYLNLADQWNITNDDFIRTTETRHMERAQKFWQVALENEDIYKKEYEGLYCVGCESFKTEKDLIDGKCPDHNKEPEELKEENYFFKLSKYQPRLLDLFENKPDFVFPKSRFNEMYNILRQGLEDISISRSKEKLPWGVPVPGDNSQVMYVWFDALTNYITALGYGSGDDEKFKRYWPADAHIIGKEINRFHSLLWPAMLMSAGLPLPKEIFIHGLLTVNGQKMSKTIGNIIDPIELAEKFGADAVRYLLLSQFPASEHGDVKAEEFARKYNSDLANGIGNLLERSFTMMIDYRGGILGDKNGLEEKIKSSVEKTEKNYENNFDNYKLYEALADVFAFIKKLDVYINEEQPWALNKNKDNKLDMVLSTLLFGIEKIIVWLEPFMPNKIGEVKNHILKLQSGKLKKGDKLGLFPRI